MRQPPQIRLLPDGRRLHMHDGPIDLIVEAFAPPAQVRDAYDAASHRFLTILDELCSELALLRSPMNANSATPVGIVARRMRAAVAPFTPGCFITPMAAVAGAVAEEILFSMTSATSLTRAYVNNGGDIAFHLDAGQHFTAAMIDRPDRPSLFGTATLHADQRVRGIATSGWRGRSFSLGIADAVTVLAATASEADAAATVIANAVDLPGHPAILREPANQISPDSDLGSIPVTRAVAQLNAIEISTALATGASVALDLQQRNLIAAAALHLQHHTRIIDLLQLALPQSDLRSPLHA